MAFWKRKQGDAIEAQSDALYRALKSAVTRGGRIRVEDLISACAAVVGEAAITAAGDYDPRRHDHLPGSRVFSTNVNKVLCHDRGFREAPADSVVGILRERLVGCGFVPADFPDLQDVFQYFAANIGRKEDWGKVPLSVPAQHYPVLLPLKVAYETRALVDRTVGSSGTEPSQRLRVAVLALAKALCETRDVLARSIATTLALETINGMAKTAPMTAAAMAMMAEKQSRT
jgi:hypothetical protein